MLTTYCVVWSVIVIWMLLATNKPIAMGLAGKTMSVQAVRKNIHVGRTVVCTAGVVYPYMKHVEIHPMIAIVVIAVIGGVMWLFWKWFAEAIEEKYWANDEPEPPPRLD